MPASRVRGFQFNGSDLPYGGMTRVRFNGFTDLASESQPCVEGTPVVLVDTIWPMAGIFQARKSGESISQPDNPAQAENAAVISQGDLLIDGVARGKARARPLWLWTPGLHRLQSRFP